MTPPMMAAVRDFVREKSQTICKSAGEDVDNDNVAVPVTHQSVEKSTLVDTKIELVDLQKVDSRK